MTQVFVISPEAYHECAAEIGHGLSQAGYRLWQNQDDIPPDNLLYPQTLRSGIMASKVIVLIWGRAAAADEFGQWQLLVAQQSRKLILPVQLDDEPLPNTLVNVEPVGAASGCAQVVAALPLRLPGAAEVDELDEIMPKLGHKYIRERRAGIEQIRQLLQPEQAGPISHEEAYLAALEMIAIHDPIGNMRRLAQSVLEERHRDVAQPSFPPNESRHMMGVRCSKGHVSWYDKRQICPASGKIIRLAIRLAGQELDEMSLECEYCDETTVVSVDCEGYK